VDVSITRGSSSRGAWLGTGRALPCYLQSFYYIPHLHLGLQNGLFPSGFSTKIMFKFVMNPMCATCPAYLIHLGLVSLSVFGGQRKL
jgi:hypothetical protein